MDALRTRIIRQFDELVSRCNVYLYGHNRKFKNKKKAK